MIPKEAQAEEEKKPKEELEKKVEEIADSKQTVEPVEKSDLEKLKEDNDAYEQELMRKENLRAKEQLGGRASAGQAEESQEDKDNKEAAEHLSKFQ